MYVTCIFVKRQGKAQLRVMGQAGRGRRYGQSGVFPSSSWIWSAVRRRVRREKRFFCSPRWSPVQYLIDFYNTYLTCTDPDFSNGLWKMFLLQLVKTRQPLDIIMRLRLRACPLRPVMLFSPNQEFGPLSGSKKEWRPSTATKRSQRG